MMRPPWTPPSRLAPISRGTKPSTVVRHLVRPITLELFVLQESDGFWAISAHCGASTVERCSGRGEQALRARIDDLVAHFSQ